MDEDTFSNDERGGIARCTEFENESVVRNESGVVWRALRAFHGGSSVGFG